MSEYKGRMDCPRCGPAAVALADWTIFVSAVCRACGYKFGELIPGPGPANGEPGPSPDRRLLDGMTLIASLSCAGEAQRMFNQGYARGLADAGSGTAVTTVEDPQGWCDYGYNTALAVFPDHPLDG